MPDPSETADSISGTKPLSTLTLEQDLAAIASLPRPEKSRLATASSRDCFNATRNFCEMWRALVSFKIRLPASPVTMKCSRCGKGHELQGEALFSRVALSLGAYYDYGANRLIATKLPKGEQLIPGLNIPGLRKFMDASLPEDTPHYVFTAKLDASEYFMSLLGSYFFTTFRRLPVMLGAAAVFNDAALASLLSLHSRHCEMEAGSLRLLVGRLIHSCLHLLQRVSSDEAAGWNKEHAFGPFSAIRLDEVSLLARRDGTMTRKYGEKHVERVFEQQLALIVQSLGLYVVQTKTGTRTIDLVCISPDTTVHASILVEAKTSTHPYGLPTKDERALRESSTTSNGPLRRCLRCVLSS
jgi:hypothetical protein